MAARFCEECGAALDRVCSSCGHTAGPKAKFCADCGQPLGSAAAVPTPQDTAAPRGYTPEHLDEQLTGSRAALEGERKHVTVLFCDIADSTALAERLGPEAFHLLLNRFFELSLAAVHRYEGMVNQFLGDGLMALFGAPITHEDHARRAVLAALGIQRGVAEHLADLGSTGGRRAGPTTDHAAVGQDGEAGPVRVRIGLNTGTVVVGAIGDNLRRDYTAMGDATNTAARLQQLAEPGSILISEATARLVTGYARLEALGPTRLRGRREPINVYRVVGPGPRRSPLEGLAPRQLSRFVGRDRQLAELHDLLQQVEQGRGQAVGVVAEPGMGKSRLVYEFRGTLGRKRVTFLEGRCLSYGSAVPYLPILEILRNNCGIAETDGPEAIAAKVRSAVQEVEMEPAECAPYILHLFGVQEAVDQLSVLSPEAVRARTFETLRRMSLLGSRRRPIIFLVEDLHWIDTTSEEYLASLVESFAGCPIMLLSTYRPRYVPPWLDRSYSTQITLQRLAPRDSLSIVRSVLEAEQVPEPLAQVILGKAEGNPFFLEELSKAVAEHDDFRAELAVPDTVQGVLAARIDRLPEKPRRVLQTASVLGREFSPRLLEVIWDGPGAVRPHVLELKRLEFLYERSGAEEPVYVFKHALTQDVAYDSLLLSRRKALHAAAGRALETLYADRLADVYDRLAYHYARTDEAAKAVEYLTRFAERAAGMHAHADAVTALQEARAHAERLHGEAWDRHCLDLVHRQANSLLILGRFQEVLDLLLQQQALAERLQDASLTGRHYFWLGYTFGYLGDQQRAAQSARRAIDEAEPCGDQATLGEAYWVLARATMWSCDFLQAIEQGRRAVSLLERAGERRWLAEVHWVVGVSYCFLGEFEPALESIARLRAIGDAMADARLRCYADWMDGLIYATRGDWQAGIESLERSLGAFASPVNTALSLGFLGLAHLEKGDPARAIPELEEGITHFGRSRFRLFEGWLTALLGEAYLLNGDVGKARDLVLRGLAVCQETRFSYGVALARRALGRIARACGALPEAEVHLEQALQTFASIHARFEAARTLLTLAELAHARGDRETAARHLQAANEVFTTLRVPKFLAAAERLGQQYGVQQVEAATIPDAGEVSAPPAGQVDVSRPG